MKNAVICKDACRVWGDWWTDLSNKNCWFRKHRDYPTVADRNGEIGNEWSINILNAPDERQINEENPLNPCRITSYFLTKL